MILAGGVINSPQLLMLSGIGDPDELRAHGIAVTAPLPGVGRNLQDHVSAGITYAPPGAGAAARQDARRPHRVELAKAYFSRQGHRRRPAGRR